VKTRKGQRKSVSKT